MTGDIPHLTEIPENWKKDASPWRTMESAPKDRALLLWDATSNAPVVGRWDISLTTRRASWKLTTAYWDVNATHWTELPPPPVVEK